MKKKFKMRHQIRKRNNHFSLSRQDDKSLIMSQGGITAHKTVTHKNNYLIVC